MKIVTEIKELNELTVGTSLILKGAIKVEDIKNPQSVLFLETQPNKGVFGNLFAPTAYAFIITENKNNDAKTQAGPEFKLDVEMAGGGITASELAHVILGNADPEVIVPLAPDAKTKYTLDPKSGDITYIGDDGILTTDIKTHEVPATVLKDCPGDQVTGREAIVRMLGGEFLFLKDDLCTISGESFYRYSEFWSASSAPLDYLLKQTFTIPDRTAKHYYEAINSQPHMMLHE